MNTTAQEIYQAIEAGRAPLLLDVRNEAEFARWKVEGRSAPETLNLPYFQFIEDEAASLARVRDWLQERDRPLVVVCAKGGSSEYVADLLQGHGIGAQNLEGGMVEWGRRTVLREIPASPVRIGQILRFGKGCLSYLLALGRDAVLVDPHRQADDYLRHLRGQGLTLRAVFDTHLHADHISGGAALARAASVPYFGHRADFEATAHAMEPVADRGRMRLGAIEIAPLVFLHGPGHTPGSTALLVNDQALLAGDTLFVESVGRPDLAGQAAAWGSDLYRTLHDRFAGLPDGTLVLPAHSGSAREARPDGSVAVTLGALRRGSDSLRLDEAAFVAWVSGTMAAAPAHYDRIRRVNLGREAAGEDEQVTMELGRNECAAGRPPVR